MNGFPSQRVKNVSFVVEIVVESKQRCRMSLRRFVFSVRVLSFDMWLKACFHYGCAALR